MSERDTPTSTLSSRNGSVGAALPIGSRDPVAGVFVNTSERVRPWAANVPRVANPNGSRPDHGAELSSERAERPVLGFLTEHDRLAEEADQQPPRGSTGR